MAKKKRKREQSDSEGETSYKKKEKKKKRKKKEADSEGEDKSYKKERKKKETDSEGDTSYKKKEKKRKKKEIGSEEVERIGRETVEREDTSRTSKENEEMILDSGREGADSERDTSYKKEEKKRKKKETDSEQDTSYKKTEKKRNKKETGSEGDTSIKKEEKKRKKKETDLERETSYKKKEKKRKKKETDSERDISYEKEEKKRKKKETDSEGDISYKKKEKKRKKKEIGSEEVERIRRETVEREDTSKKSEENEEMILDSGREGDTDIERLTKSVKIEYTFVRERRSDLFEVEAHGYGRLTVQAYNSKDDALAVTRILDEVKHSTICGFLALDAKSEEKYLMLMERSFDGFDDWLLKELQIWEYNKTCKSVVSMGASFLKVFNGIITGLRALHVKDKFHGNLRNGVTISENEDVRLINISAKQGDINQGIDKDVADLTDMVREVVNKHPPTTGIKIPSMVELFLEFGGLFDDPEISENSNEYGNPDWKKSRVRAFFSMHNLIFANSEKRRQLTKKFLDIYHSNQKDHENMGERMLFEDPKTSMENWSKPMDGPGYCSKTYHFSGNRKSIYHKKPLGILELYRDCYHHTETKKGMTENKVEQELNDVFPDFLPKFYYEFVRKIILRNPEDGTAKRFMGLFQSKHPRFP